MKWARFLWTSKQDGEPSSSKLWRHVAYAAATYVVVKQAPTIEWSVLLVYMAVVGGSEIAMRVLEWKIKSSSPTSKEG